VREIVRYGTVLGLICAISALVLSATYNLTRARVEEAQAQAFQEALAQVLLGEHEFIPVENLADKLGGRFNSVKEAYIAAGPQFNGLAVRVSQRGYAGQIEAVVGILPSGEISGVRIMQQSETPGLGGEIVRERFLGQFVGASDIDSLQVKQDGGSIDAVTGATISSRVVVAEVRDALQVFRLLRDQGLFDELSASPGGSERYSVFAEVLPGQYEFEAIENLSERLTESVKSVKEAFVAVGHGPVGLVVKAGVDGYAGPIEVVVGIAAPTGEISGVRVVSQSETPGFGTEVAEAEFLDQFVGLSNAESVRVKQDGGVIDAVTRATVSSRAVATAVRDALLAFESLRDQGLLAVSE